MRGIGAIRLVVICIASALCLCVTAAAHGADETFAGTFKNDKLILVLHGDPDRLGHFDGSIQLGADTFPVSAQVSGATLEGTFANKGADYPFSANLAGEDLTFKTASTTYTLKREPPNPLDAPPAAAAKFKPPNPLDIPPVAIATPKPPMPPVVIASPKPLATRPTTRAIHHDDPTTRPSRAELVDASIAKAKKYLYARQKNGNWEEVPARNNEEDYSPRGGQWGGYTALATYALLAAGESPQNPPLAQAIEFLKHADLAGTYAIAMRAQIWNLLPPKADGVQEAMQRDALLLANRARQTGPERAFFHYLEHDGGYDHSCSQYGVLGFWACNQAGLDVPLTFWADVEQAWQRDQRSDGGWNYYPDESLATTPSMTAAGVATLFITQDYVHAMDGIDCHGNVTNPAIDAGLKWMSDHFDQIKPGTDHFFYTLYGVERIGVASGHKYFGPTDWYVAGADQILQHQNDDGSFGDGIADTSFSILFMVRGSAAVVMNKLQYSLTQRGGKSEEANWNQRPRDVANITRWISRELESDHKWQIVNLGAAVDELHDAPILYMAGNQGLNFTAEEEAKLRQFVEDGGLIVGNADCGSVAFAQTFKKLGSRLFPLYEFRDLPPQHLIYGNLINEKGKWRGKPPGIQGVTNGCRELMLLSPYADQARAWQAHVVGGHEEAFELLQNIFLYTVSRNNNAYRGRSYIVRPDPTIAADRTGKVARLQYAGNWDPEPGGWRRLVGVMHNDYRTDLAIESVNLGDGKLAGQKIAHLTGTAAFHFTDGQRAELKRFIDAGGMLIVDAAGGSTRFAASAETELTTLFGTDADSLHNALGLDNPLFAAVDPKIDEVHYRTFARRLVGNLRGPRIKAITIKGRIAVLFSAEDLSVGLVGEPIDGIYGYDPATATALMADMVLYAAQR